ncbi:MAG: transglutaminase [Comamonadaceae bacterium]|nr:MAG: transglutaminase [Comamonadaceae bacterium]
MATQNTQAAWHPWLRPIARCVIGAHVALALQPLSVLAQDRPTVSPAAQQQMQRAAQWQQRIEEAKLEQRAAQQTPGARASERTSRNLTSVHELVRGIAQRAGRTSPGAAGARQLKAAPQTMTAEEMQQITDLLRTIDADTQAVLADFDAMGAELRSRSVSAEIHTRHDQTRADLQARAQELRAIIAQWNLAPGEAVLDALGGYFERYPAAKPRVPTEPGQLPWRTPEPSRRAPAETPTAWFQNLHQDKKVALAQAGGASPGLQFDIAPEPGQAPTAADLAETAEVVLTPAIRAKAQELGDNPVAIQNWVRNTIEWVPTWGAIQSAQDTLDKSRGNAIDIASLQIALLRAAGIPARYQFGTVEIPAAQAMNWVGNASNPQAALQIMAQGGMAVRGLAQGGAIQAIRLEHAWVQAYVNWAPGRGSRNATPTQHVHPNSGHNAWVALDASAKQYSYAPAMDLQAAVPLDAQALLTAAQSGATVNEAQGWVQNINQTAIQSQLDQYQNRLKTYIDTNKPNATVGDVIGKKIVAQNVRSVLAGVTPLALVQAGQQTAAVPRSLQHQFTYTLSDTWGEPLLSYSAPTSQLVGKRLTLSYIPADQATTDLIASYLPKPHADGSPIQPSELPTSLPGYLIRLKPQITLDGQPVAQATTAITMGTNLQGQGGFTQLYDPTQWDVTPDESHVAGQATAIGISAGGISAAQLDTLKARLENTKTQLQAQNVQNLTGEQISGDLLTAVIWSWFAAAESHNRLSQNQAGIVENPGLSYGLFHAVANPVYSWGVVRKVEFPGVNVDIGHMRNITWAKDNDSRKWVNYNRLRGQYMSALEHAVPERFFNDPAQCNLQGATAPTAGLPDCPQGISAVKALGIAAAQGQKIYTITQSVYANNPNIVNTALGAHSYDTRSRVQQSLDAGNEVTIHERPITESRWTGAGFTTIDPTTGAGAYTIDGGSNGAWLYLLMTFVFALLALSTLAMFGPFAILGYGWMLFASAVSAGKYLDAIGAEVNWPAVSNWIGVFLAVVGLAALIPVLGVTILGSAAMFAAIAGVISAIYSVIQ